jgi:hypothetical protein
MGCGAIVSIRAGDAGDAICCEEEYPGAKPRGQDAPYQFGKKTHCCGIAALWYLEAGPKNKTGLR